MEHDGRPQAQERLQSRGLPAQRGGALDVEQLRRTLRSAEERKVTREVRLRNLGVAITRDMPREVRTLRPVQAFLLARCMCITCFGT